MGIPIKALGKTVPELEKLIARTKTLRAAKQAFGKFINKINIPGRLGEKGLGEVLGVETRAAAPTRKVLVKAAVPAQAAQPEVVQTFRTPTSYGSRLISPAKPAVEGSEAVYKEIPIGLFKGKPLAQSDLSLTAVGSLGQLLGWTGAGLGVGAIGAGVAAAKSAYGHKDENGVLNENATQEGGDIRQKYIKSTLGGTDTFNPTIYENLTKQQPWVKTAIGKIGKERYLELRKSGDAAKIHNALITAISHDPEAMKNASKSDIILPGLAEEDSGDATVDVLHLNNGKPTIGKFKYSEE